MVRNERLKLLANALDRASTAAVAIGIFGQVIGGAGVASITLLAVIPWIVAAVALHVLAQVVLGRLRP